MRNPLQLLDRRASITVLLLAATLFFTACGRGRPPSGDPVLTTRAGGFSWDVWLSPDPPRQDGTSLWLKIEGAGGEPVAGADIRSGYLMPAMGSMAEMRGDGTVSDEGEGLYRVAFDFPMQGIWTLDLAVQSDSGRAEVEYSLTTGAQGLREISVSASVPAPPVSLPEVEAHADAAHGGDIAYYTCSMHPSVEQEAPGTCPICSMNLTPVTREELETGVIRIGAERRQEIGVRTAAIETRPVTVTIRAVATVTHDETRLHEVSLKNRGWIERLFVEETGQPVRRGQTLFTLYSPELLSAQEELLTALVSQKRARESEAPGRADYLVDAARRRLSLWDLSDDQIDEIVRSGEPIQNLPIPSPASGFVLEKNVVEGAAVEPGQALYRIADLSTLWLQAEVYESELPLVEVGQEAEVIFPYLPGRRLRARVAYVYPYLERGSRTGTVRLELPNPGLELKPDMYADVVLEVSRGDRVVVPEEAVIYAGPRRLVFLDLGEGRLQPRPVELGVKSGDSYEVLSGLEAGDVVVTSGNFLVAAESRLKSATEKW